MKISFNGDLPESAGRTIVGVEIPKALDGVPFGNLRLVDGKIVDVSKTKTFYVDEDGQKHVVQTKPTWQRVACSVEDDLVREGVKWVKPTASMRLAPEIKAECRRRIYAVLKDSETATNLLAIHAKAARAEAKGKAKAAEKAKADLVEDGLAWVEAMRAASRSLIEAADADYARGDKWPSAPAGLKALADEV